MMAKNGNRVSKRQAGLEVTPMLETKKKKNKKTNHKKDIVTDKVVDEINHKKDTVTDKVAEKSDKGDEIASEKGDNSFHEEDDVEASESINNDEVEEAEHTQHLEEETGHPTERVSISEEVQTQQSETKKRKTRGPTKMRKVAKHHEDKVDVEFTSIGEHVGTGSVTLSSFLGTLVRENVTVLLDDWRYLDNEMKDTLWEEIQGRFNMTEEWKKDCCFRTMNNIWRSSKSKLTSKVRAAKSRQELQALKPENIQSMTAWNNWVRNRNSAAFKVKSDHFKKLKQLQIPHTTSRKGLGRLAHEMRKKSSDPSKVTRSKVWVAGHTHADGTPVREEFAETIEKIKTIDSEMESTATDNIRDDAVSQVLGKDKPGRVRGLGRGYTLTKLSYLQARDSYVQKLEATRTELLNEMKDLRNVVHELAGRKREDNNVNTSEVSRVGKGGVRCQLLDWCSSDDAIVGEGEFCSADHMYKIGRLPIGPNAVAVIVKSIINPEAPVWRQTSTIEKLGDCVGMKITWPAEKVKLDNDIEPPETETESSLAARASAGRVYIFNYWNLDEEIIGEGILCSTDPSYLFNNLPLGPNGAIVKVDHVNKGDAFLWRPTSEIPNLGAALNENIAWPIERIKLVKPVTPPEDTSRKSMASATNSTSSSKGKKTEVLLVRLQWLWNKSCTRSSISI